MRSLRNIALAAALLGGVATTSEAQTYAQSFTTPAGNPQLLSFVWGGLGTSDPFTFGVRAFDGVHLTGAVLWSQTFTDPVSYEDHTYFPNIPLLGSSLYAVTLDVGGSGQQIGQYYTGGEFYISDGQGSYNAYFNGGDAAHFAVDFGESEVAPEPASLLLVGTGLVGLIGFARRKRA